MNTTIENLLKRKAELDRAIDGINRYFNTQNREVMIGDCTRDYWTGFMMPAEMVTKAAQELREKHQLELKIINEALTTLEKVAIGLVSAAKP